MADMESPPACPCSWQMPVSPCRDAKKALIPQESLDDVSSLGSMEQSGDGNAPAKSAHAAQYGRYMLQYHRIISFAT